MLLWTCIILSVLLIALLSFILLRKRSNKDDKVSNVDFNRYKSQEIHKRGHYHDIVK